MAQIHSRVFEDNQGALALAHRPHATSRTRHLNTKYHHFKEHLGVKNGEGIELKYIQTESQLADMLMKGLGHDLFEQLRDCLMGWVPFTTGDTIGTNKKKHKDEKQTIAMCANCENCEKRKTEKLNGAGEGVLEYMTLGVGQMASHEPSEHEKRTHEKDVQTQKSSAGRRTRRGRRRRNKNE